jgi:hypothetical protein
MPWISRVRALFRRKELAQELEEELRFHLSMREEWNVERGLPRAEAHRAARLRFGNLNLWREQMSEVDLMTCPRPSSRTCAMEPACYAAMPAPPLLRC